MENPFNIKSLDNSRTNTLEGLTLSADESESLSANSAENENVFIGEPQLIAIVGDEDTCVGFILAGIGQINEEDMTQNFIVVDPKTDDFELELMFLDLLERPDIGLILITREAAEKISNLLHQHKGLNPTIMIIPGHNGPFEIDLPIAVKDIEDRRKSAMSNGNKKTSIKSSNTSIKTHESIPTAGLSRKVSTHSIRSVLSAKSLKL